MPRFGKGGGSAFCHHQPYSVNPKPMPRQVPLAIFPSIGRAPTCPWRSPTWVAGSWLVSIALCGCQTLLTQTKSLPFQHEIVRGQLVLHSDFPLPQEHRLINDLVAARHQVQFKLGLTPNEEPVHIYLFAEKAAYYDYLQIHFPGFMNRRALFVETNIALSVYAHWGDHVAEDLRHEVVHGYLHAAVPNLPLWLDEGLAEYFEVARSRHGLNESHVEFLRDRRGESFDLARLEKLTSAEDMTQEDYAESWAWVYFLLESADDRQSLLTDYLADLSQGNSGPTLSKRLHKRLATPELTLAEYLQTVR
ncbi:MAG: DUF1570 domain-containing protein [Pirellulales bacterium]|nr:DUF1570 domain-containing protein [Pirellulales bacterium]